MGATQKTARELYEAARTGRMYLELTERHGIGGDRIPAWQSVRRRVLRAGKRRLFLEVPVAEYEREQGRLPERVRRRGSELSWVSAACLEYTGDALAVYAPGRRLVTAEERAVQKAFREAAEAHGGAWRDGELAWFAERFFSRPEWSGYGYLKGDGKFEHGKQLWGEYVTDKAVRGELLLRYRVVFADEGTEADGQ